MKFYDRLCRECGWRQIDSLEPTDAPLMPCPTCGDPTVRAWLTKSSNVIGDEMDHVQVNGLKEPRRFRSKLERKRWMKEAGWEQLDTHVGEQGSDKNRHTQRWPAGGGKDWLANAEALASRHGGLGTKEPEDEPFHVTWTTGELTPQQVEEYRAKNR